MYEVRGTRYRVRGTRYEVRGTGHGVRGMWYEIQGTWCRVHGTGHSRAQMNNKDIIFVHMAYSRLDWNPPARGVAGGGCKKKKKKKTFSMLLNSLWIYLITGNKHVTQNEFPPRVYLVTTRINRTHKSPICYTVKGGGGRTPHPVHLSLNTHGCESELATFTGFLQQKMHTHYLFSTEEAS